ncbi:MAG: ABC transporter ATP-binding protein [Myxococcales bacterium]|nr:ABC transporter ATP-binding protein [Myxococcales bacterium]
MTAPLIQTEGLTRHFGDRVAVDSVDLELYSGEIFGFLGPNGAGKTTTIRMLSAMIAPTSGRVVVDGVELGRDNDAIRGKIGLLTEAPGHYPKLTALENLTLYSELHELSDGDARMEELLKLVGLWDRRDDATVTYSKGMQQKLAIARTLLHRPKILFLDEPTSGLDPQASKMVRDLVDSLRDHGQLIVLCTHNLDEASRLCDRVGIFKQRLLRIDKPEHLQRDAMGRRVKITCGAPPSEAVLARVRELFPGRAFIVDGNELEADLDDLDRDSPVLVKHLVEDDVAVVFVEPLEKSLEAVYLELVGDPTGE